MKKLKFIIPICIFVIGFAVFFIMRVTDDERNNGVKTGNSDDNTRQESDDSLIYADVDEALSLAPDALKETYDNLKLPDEVYKFTDGNVSQLYNITACASGGDQILDKDSQIATLNSYMQAVLGNDVSIEIDDNNFEECQEIYGISDMYWCTSYPYGLELFYVTDGSGFMDGVRNDVYRLDCGDSIENVSLPNGYNAQDAIDRVNEHISTYLQENDFADELCAKTLMIYECADGSRTFVIRYEHVTDGVAYNDLMDGVHSQSGFFRETFYDFALNDDTSPIQFEQYGLMKILNKEPIEDNRIITLQSALKTASEYLAPYGVYNVSDIKLKYCCVRKMPGENYSQEEIDAYNSAQFTYRPMWCLIVKTGEPIAYSPDMDPRMEIIIDAQDGTVYLYDTVDKTGPYFTLE